MNPANAHKNGNMEDEDSPDVEISAAIRFNEFLASLETPKWNLLLTEVNA